ncbi:MAG TPA: twin-arginine translocase subunit TatC [Gemmatimonadaceae bacterium]|nr:twin-arginine translocase subunit TatC [Gemmatimonadaceae bacterium]
MAEKTGKGGATEMPFLDHLEELRWRILWSLSALIVGMIVGFVVVLKFDVVALLLRPVKPFLAGGKLVYTHPADPFNITLTTALALGIVLALPVIIYQLWAFVSPALYRHEKRVVIPILAGATLLFLAGVALAFAVVLPFTLSFLSGFGSASLQPMITASEYFGFALGMSLAFGAVFELPIVILLLTALGIVNPETLARFRRHAFVACFLVAAVITPGDVLSATLVLVGPLYGLYEVGILLSRIVHRRRLAKEQAAAAESDAATQPGYQGAT